MHANQDNFVRWFKEPLESLYTNIHAGFVILMASLPLLERYLRQKSRVFENHALNPEFFGQFRIMFPSIDSPEKAKRFWEIYRHGLLHQATLKTRDGTIAAALHNNAHILVVSYDPHGDVFTLSPNKFSQKIIAVIESDFLTFEAAGSPHHRPAQVDSDTGRSGYHTGF